MKIQLLEKLLGPLTNGIIVLNLKREVVFANKASREFFTGDIGEKIGNYIKCIFAHQDNCQKSRDCKKCLLKSTIDIAIESCEAQILSDVTFLLFDKRISLTCKVNFLEDEELVVIELLNLTETEKKLEFLLKAFDKSKDIIFYKNANLQYEYVNKFGIDLFTADGQCILGKKDSEIISIDSAEKCLEGDLKALRQGRSYELETIGNRLFKVEKEHLNGGILGVARDITDEAQAVQKSEIDPLTNLYNRRKFKSVIDEIYDGKIVAESFYLALIDLDDLRVLNNEYGHLKGDEYLVKVGEILNSYPEGMFFRLGGDEFVGLIPREKESVRKIFESIFSRIEREKLIPKLSLSVGVRKLDLSKEYFENISQVDKVLYYVKENGKNNFLIED